jgi:hypothetical protein
MRTPASNSVSTSAANAAASREPLPGVGGGQRIPVEVVKTVSEPLEPGRRLRRHDSRHLGEAAQGLPRPGGIGRDEVGDRRATQGCGGFDARTDVAGDIPGRDPVPQRSGREQSREIVPQVLGDRGQPFVVEAEPDHILEHPQGLPGPVGGGVDGPPDAGVSGRGRRFLWFPVLHGLPTILPAPNGRPTRLGPPRPTP